MTEDRHEEAEGDVQQLALKVASDITPFGLALGEMLRTLDEMDKKLADACIATAPAPDAGIGADEGTEPAT